ncbi:30S ribosomal protein S18 [Patescibacteria group bacterium]|nr:30S ribosomal protein S18 [Patescibacteria group bacterium]
MAKFRRKVCSFCQDKGEPDYKDVTSLRRFTTERGKIVPRTKTGVCAKHGRALTTAVKRARYMSLLPFATKIK